MNKDNKQRPTDFHRSGSNHDVIIPKPNPRQLEEAKLEDEEFERLDKQSQSKYNERIETNK